MAGTALATPASDLVERMVAGDVAICAVPRCANVFELNKQGRIRKFCHLATCAKNWCKHCDQPKEDPSSKSQWCQRPDCIEERKRARKPITVKDSGQRAAVRRLVDKLEAGVESEPIELLLRQIVNERRTGGEERLVRQLFADVALQAIREAVEPARA